MSAVGIQGRGRRNAGEDIQRISIQHPPPGNFKQKSMVEEKIRAKDEDGDQIKMEGPGELTGTKPKSNGSSSKARERSSTSSEKAST